MNSKYITKLVDNTLRGVYAKSIMQTNKPKLIRHLKILEGQVRGLQNMLLKDTYCIDVITQTSAIKQGLSNIEDALMEGHLGHCVVKQIKNGQTDKATKEILKVYQLKRK